MKITTVIVSYNFENGIFECLDLLSKSSIKTEIVVIDNNSSDKTTSVIENNFNNINFIKCIENIGFGNANNIGMKIALEKNSDFVFLLNQDAFVEKDTLKNLVESAVGNPQYGIISPIHLNGDGSGLDEIFSKHYISTINCPGFVSDLYVNKLKDIYTTNFVNAAAWLIPKTCLQKIGGFNPVYFLYGEDNDYCNRLVFHKFDIGICTSARVRHLRSSLILKTKSEQKLFRIKRHLLFRLFITLTDINQSFVKSIFSITIKAGEHILINLIKLDFYSAFYISKGLVEILLKSKNIIKNRTISKSSNAAFISK